jgi:CheY-like chemotaxis protein
MTTILLGKECSPFLEIDDSLLQRAEVRLVWAETSDAYARLAREHRPHVIVLDPQVPGFDAAACAAALRRDAALASTVILLIGNRSAKRATVSGSVDGTLARPVTQERLLDAMRRHGITVERTGDRVEVAIKVDLTHGARTSLAYTRDLAVDGCFLHTHEPFSVGDRVGLAFQLPTPGGRDLRIEGVVLRVGSGGIALKFSGLAPGDRVELGRFLRKRRQADA